MGDASQMQVTFTLFAAENQNKINSPVNNRSHKITTVGRLRGYSLQTPLAGVDPSHPADVCMYVCMVTDIAKVWINWARMSILLVVS